MKNIIQNLSLSAGLQLVSIREKIDFAFYADKDDFFLFIYFNESDIMQEVGDDIKDLEYALNNIVAEAKNSSTLASLSERNINYNLSLILFAELDGSDPAMLNEFNKVEENYINAKKYVLPYNVEVLRQLTEKMVEGQNISTLLNNLAITYSDSIQNIGEKWYELLLNLFIKIPFLNYESTQQNLTIESLSESITDSLSIGEAELLSIVNETDFSSVGDIESFARSKNILE